MSASPPSKEARLLKVIGKLESKVRTIWEDNNDLKKKVELAQLDKEIAEEQCQAFQDELETTKTRIGELEELRKLNDELVASYVSEKQRLETDKLSLENELSQSHLRVQNFESLHLELAETTRLLELADIELGILRNGAANTLGPIFAENSETWLAIVDFLELDITPQLQKLRKEDLAMTKFRQLLMDYVDKCIDDPDTYKNLTRTDVPGQFNTDTPMWKRVSGALVRNKTKKSDEIVTTKEPLNEPRESTEANVDSTLTLRISILESKLLKAQEVAQELEECRRRLQRSKDEHVALEREVEKYKSLVAARDAEVAHLRKENLPNELSSLNSELYVKSLHSCIAFLSTKRPSLVLDELETGKEPKEKVSQFVGNRRIANLRKLATTFNLGSTPQEARKLAIEQRAALMLL